jgi:hypothetical protein
MTSMLRAAFLATMQVPAAPLPPPTGDDHDVNLGLLLEDLERDGRDACDQVGFVA